MAIWWAQERGEQVKSNLRIILWKRWSPSPSYCLFNSEQVFSRPKHDHIATKLCASSNKLCWDLNQSKCKTFHSVLLRDLVNSAPNGPVVNNFLPKFFQFPLSLWPADGHTVAPVSIRILWYYLLKCWHGSLQGLAWVFESNRQQLGYLWAIFQKRYILQAN